MTYNRLPDNTPALLRSAGLRVVEVDGWRGRGRPASTGELHPGGVLCHHTASSANGQAALGLLINGRSDLPGPLCHFSLDRQGTVYIVAAGRANHAGKAKPSGTMAGGDGNALYWGIEAQNRGTGEKWPKAQYDAYVLLCAAISVHITHNSAQTVRAHKETSVTGKIDPAGPTPYEGSFDMGRFRARVATQMKRLTAPQQKEKPVPEQTPDHPWKGDPNYGMTHGPDVEALKDQMQDIIALAAVIGDNAKDKDKADFFHKEVDRLNDELNHIRSAINAWEWPDPKAKGR